MEVLEVSKPILTDNDYIIYKLDGLLNYSNNDFSKKRIKEKIINSYYGNLLERKIIKELKSSNSFKFNQKDYDSYLNFAKNKDIKSIKNLRNNNFFKINSFEIPMTLICDSLVNYAAKNPKADLYSYFKTYSENRLDSDLMFYYSNYFDELPHIVKYAEKIKDGLALEYAFDILIGEKAEKDIEGQKKYFSENKKKYIFPIRANSILYTCANNEIADKVEKLVKDNKSVVEIKDLMKKNSSSDNIDLFITQGLFVENSEKFPKNTKFKKGIQRVKQAGASVIVQIKAIEESREKTFEEAQKEVIQNYTAYFLNNTIKELKSKYKISINSEAISLLEKKYKR